MSQPLPQSNPTDTLKKNGYAAAMIVPLSLVLFIYERALVPLYASGPTSYMLKPTVILAAALAALDPIAIPISWNWFLIGLSLSLAPNANYWVAVWTGRYGKPLAGAATTHATVLFPLVFLFFTAATNGVFHQVAPSSSTPTPLIASRPELGQRVVQVAIVYFMATSLSQDLFPVLNIFNSLSESNIYLGLASIFWLAWIFTASIFNPPEPAAAAPTPAAPVPAPKADAKSKTKTKKQPTAPEAAPKQPEATESSAPSKKAMSAAAIFTAVFSLAQPILRNPVLPHPLQKPYNSTDGTFRVLSAEQSITGLITVVDWLPPTSPNDTSPMHSARYLRASHSILGGVWTHDKVMVLDQDSEPLKDLAGVPLGDSIYATFVVQEAVRLVDSHKKLDNALVIGLGIGTAASSLMRHGVDTTIVEIDPAVYNAAKTYFGLPDPGEDKVFLQDARGWVARRKQCVKEGKCELFDAAIHDCFSGGGVPQHIFTLEFWNDLKSIMHPDGVLVLNFAGIVNSESTRLVLNTLMEAFGQCRAFHDYFDKFTDETYNEEFLNMVLFCANPEEPLTFRKAKHSDYLSSPLRRHILSGLESREVKLDALLDNSGKYIVTDQHNPLGKLQDEQGAHHWEVMRKVLPDSHWETF